MTIADYLDADDPALLAWQKAYNNCHMARVERIMREQDEARERRASGEEE